MDGASAVFPAAGAWASPRAASRGFMREGPGERNLDRSPRHRAGQHSGSLALWSSPNESFLAFSHAAAHPRPAPACHPETWDEPEKSATCARLARAGALSPASIFVSPCPSVVLPCKWKWSFAQNRGKPPFSSHGGAACAPAGELRVKAFRSAPHRTTFAIDSRRKGRRARPTSG